MSNTELRIVFQGGEWIAQWLQNEVVLFEAEGANVTDALAALVTKVGNELADVTGEVEKDDEE